MLGARNRPIWDQPILIYVAADIFAYTNTDELERTPIPIPIFSFGRYLLFWPISMNFNRYLADTDIADIYMADTDIPFVATDISVTIFAN